MVEVRWTLQAIEDLEAITAFIATDSPDYASLFAMNVFAAVERLAEFPRSGKRLMELSDQSVREILFGSYRIIYRINPDLVEILTVFHGARLLNPSNLE